MATNYYVNETETTIADSASGATCSCYTPHVYQREILVEHPEHWKDEDHQAYVKLVNEQTQTGWKIKLLITGNVQICDPRIERRSMADFIPLLKYNASDKDRELIDKFFQEHPVDVV